MKNKVVPIRGNKELYLYVHSKQHNIKYVNALNHLSCFKTINPNQINIVDLLKYDKIVFTE